MPIQTSKNKRGNQQEEVQPQATKKKRGNEQEEAPSPARVRDLYNYMVKLVVTSKDGDAEEFDLFQGVLCQKSPYFRHLVDPDRAKTVHKVPGVDPAIFAYFKEWVVVGEFIFDLATHWETSGNNVYIPLIELWLLSQKFEVPGLANLTVSELLKFMRERKEAVTSTQPQYTTFTDAQRQMKNLSSSELFSWITTLQCITQYEYPEFVSSLILRLISLKNNPVKRLAAETYNFKAIKKRAIPTSSSEVINLIDDDDDVQIVDAREIKRQSTPMFVPKTEQE